MILRNFTKDEACNISVLTISDSERSQYNPEIRKVSLDTNAWTLVTLPTHNFTSHKGSNQTKNNSRPSDKPSGKRLH